MTDVPGTLARDGGLAHAPLSDRAPARHIIRFTVPRIFRVTRSITAVMEKHAHAKDNYALIALNL